MTPSMRIEAKESSWKRIGASVGIIPIIRGKGSRDSRRPVKQEAFRKASDCNAMGCLLLDPNLSGSDQIRIRTRDQIQR